MRIKLVVAHPRKNSLTFAVMNRFIDGLKENGHQIDVLDLYNDGFDALYSAEDEYEWKNPEKVFAPLVQKEMDRVIAADAFVFVFPIWWYNMPSIMKTYLDRVWNIGVFDTLAGKKVFWLALAGGTEAVFHKYDYTNMISHYLNNGIGKYARMEESKVEFLYDTLNESQEHINSLLEQAYLAGKVYA
ncbi:NAD(P)H oxidoreductase [Paenibacillus dauci]|uniref:NAD(P)H oxidoreductase n=1 Tax=Paenibacillus dauci TaxID=1567106 RepID=UPI000619CA13|nr:NAD(P)H oxidoreductase [Paenibacillus dauci]